MQISLSYRRSFELLLSVLAVSLLRLCRGTRLIELLEKLVLRTPSLFLGATAEVRYYYGVVVDVPDMCYFLGGHQCMQYANRSNWKKMMC